jgi:hypothetical protein
VPVFSIIVLLRFISWSYRSSRGENINDLRDAWVE